MTIEMVPFDSKQQAISLKIEDCAKNNISSSNYVILCNHCKRTASNRVRCLGMCVADSEY